jgi:hypothetical protein
LGTVFIDVLPRLKEGAAKVSLEYRPQQGELILLYEDAAIV